MRPALAAVTQRIEIVRRIAAPWSIRAETCLNRHRRVTAALVSLALHGLLLAALIISMASNISGGGSGGAGTHGSGTGTGFSIDLVSAQAAQPDAFKVKQPDPAEPDDITTLQLRTATAAVTALDTSQSQAIVQVSDSTAETSPSPAQAESQAAAGGAGQGGRTSGLNDSLWKQIEPCWRRLAGNGTRDAGLRVSFSPLGNVAQTADASDILSVSDANAQKIANEALAECGPYVSADSSENVVIAFPAQR